jgi:hypothetical protein
MDSPLDFSGQIQALSEINGGTRFLTFEPAQSTDLAHHDALSLGATGRAQDAKSAIAGRNDQCFTTWVMAE